MLRRMPRPRVGIQLPEAERRVPTEEYLAGERVSFDGAGYRTDDAVLLPSMSRRVPLMIGSTGERILEATVPTVDAWNVWGPWCGNDPAGFAAQNERVTRVARGLGRDPE